MTFLDRRNLQDDYVSQKSEVVKSARKDYDGRLQSVRTSIANGIKTAERHRSLLNASIFPFTRSRGQLRFAAGYEFVHGSPLSELGVKNNDFLLLKNEGRQKIAIIGEVKGTVSSPNHVVSEARTRLATAMEHLEYILAVPTSSGNDVLNRVIDTGGGIVTWSIPITGDAEVRMAFPPYSLKEGIKRQSMMHRDCKLNEALGNGIPSDRNEFSIFPQMETCLELKALLRVVRKEGGRIVIDRDRLRDLLSKDLFYMEDEYIDSKAESIIAHGQSIGFLEATQNQGIFRIVALGKNLNILESTLEKKWIDEQVAIREELYIGTKVAELQEKFRIRKDKEVVWF